MNYRRRNPISSTASSRYFVAHTSSVIRFATKYFVQADPNDPSDLFQKTKNPNISVEALYPLNPKILKPYPLNYPTNY